MKALNEVLEECHVATIVVCETDTTAMLWCGEGFPHPNIDGSIMFVHDLPESGWACWDSMCQMGESYRQELKDRLDYGAQADDPT